MTQRENYSEFGIGSPLIEGLLRIGALMSSVAAIAIHSFSDPTAIERTPAAAATQTRAQNVADTTAVQDLA